MGQCFYFKNKLHHHVRHTRAHAAGIFGNVARGETTLEMDFRTLKEALPEKVCQTLEMGAGQIQ